MFLKRISNTTPTVTRSDFLNAFDLFKPFEDISNAEIEQRVISINEQLINKATSWEVKSKLLEDLCCLLMSMNNHDAEALMRISPQWDQCLVDGPKEGRSSLVKVYCIAIGFFAYRLRASFLPVAERLLKNLFGLTQKRITIMASSGRVAIEFIFRYVQSSKLMESLPEFAKHKASEIRTEAVNAAIIIVQQWPSEIVKPHLKDFIPSFEHCIGDAGPTVRTSAKVLFKASESLLNEYQSHARTVKIYGTPARAPPTSRLPPPKTALRYRMPLSTEVTKSLTLSPPRQTIRPIMSMADAKARHLVTGSLQHLDTSRKTTIPLMSKPATNQKADALRRRTLFEARRTRSQIPVATGRRVSDVVIRTEKVKKIEADTLSATKSPVSLFSDPQASPPKSETKLLKAKVESLETRLNDMEKKLETVLHKNAELQQIVSSQVAHIALLLDLGTA
uniref:TOG domain-containing protein n=1 Tax=Panagrellus redivivus TaxID=6233 RepID=A0A7E4V4E2_PANRE